jgi:hypothetical protein
MDSPELFLLPGRVCAPATLINSPEIEVLFSANFRLRQHALTTGNQMHSAKHLVFSKTLYNGNLAKSSLNLYHEPNHF